MGAKAQAREWSGIVEDVAARKGLRYDAVGGLNPKGGPAALCPGGSNRLTGELADEFWGASCDADEEKIGGLFSNAVVPKAVLIKAHMPDLAEAVPAFNVESLERRPADYVRRTSRRRVEFESVDFNKRFIATVPSDHDPIALRELFSPGFIDWVTTIDHEVDFGCSERQLFFLWQLRVRSGSELEAALAAGGELFRRTRRELSEAGAVTFPAGPWNAGIEHFPAGRGAPRPASADSA